MIDSSMIEYELHPLRGWFGQIHGYKVLSYVTIPGKPDRVLTGTRTFDDELEAQTYMQRMQEQEHEHITLF